MLRYCILFPLRMALLLSSLALFFLMFFTVKAAMPAGKAKLRVEQRLIRFMCSMFVASWTGGWGLRGGGVLVCACKMPCCGSVGQSGKRAHADKIALPATPLNTCSHPLQASFSSTARALCRLLAVCGSPITRA